MVVRVGVVVATGVVVVAGVVVAGVTVGVVERGVAVAELEACEVVFTRDGVDAVACACLDVVLGAVVPVGAAPPTRCDGDAVLERPAGVEGVATTGGTAGDVVVPPPRSTDGPLN